MRKGFTLVELAIVLVIIGVILGGVIKGQELVTNAKIKRLYRDYQQVEFAYFSYLDRFNDKPGDDDRTLSDGSTAGGDADGTIEGDWDAGVATEARKAWDHLRGAGFYKDDLTGTDLPQHAFGDDMGIEEDIFGLTGVVVCFNNLDAEIASAFDAQFDDGVATTGSVRAGDDHTAATADYDTTTVYDVCVSVEN